jgi:hypothetical protein
MGGRVGGSTIFIPRHIFYTECTDKALQKLRKEIHLPLRENKLSASLSNQSKLYNHLQKANGSIR